jgi:hypothetical protein
MEADESHYILIAAVITGNATVAQQAELEQLLAGHDSVRQTYNELLFIYRQPLPPKNEKLSAAAVSLKSSKKNFL